jgi:hypothetical protein
VSGLSKYHSSFNNTYSIYVGPNHFDPAIARPSATTTPLPSNLTIGEDSDTDEDNEPPPPPKETSRKRKATANVKTTDGAPNKRKKMVNTAAASKGKKKAASK